MNQAKNINETSVASHSSTSGNSIEQFKNKILSIIEENQTILKSARAEKMDEVEIFETDNMYDAVINTLGDLFEIITSLK